MESQFWHQCWEQNEIGFHQGEANPFLVEHFAALSLAPGHRIFLPLCGKTLDIGWLLSKGYSVVGVELSEMAIEQLFASLGVEPEISRLGELSHYGAKDIDIYGGDFFHLSRELLGDVDAIFDRGALVALPADMRIRYTAHLMTITDRAQQLLIAYDYDQSLADGPPFSVPSGEIRRHYGDHYQVTLRAGVGLSSDVRGPDAKENVWLLQKI